MLNILFAVVLNIGECVAPRTSAETDKLLLQAQERFSVEVLNNRAVMLRSLPESAWLGPKMWNGVSRRDYGKVNGMKVALIEKITLPSSPADAGSENWIKDRGDWVGDLMLFRRPYDEAEEDFWQLCKYASTIKDIEYEFKYPGIGRYLNPATPLQMEVNRENDIRRSNTAILLYRSAIYGNCARYIEHATRWMDDGELTEFTNKVAKLVHPAEPAANILFSRIAPYAQRHRIELEGFKRVSGDYEFDRAFYHYSDHGKSNKKAGRVTRDVLRDIALDTPLQRWNAGCPLEKQWDVVIAWLRMVPDAEVEIAIGLLEDFKDKDRYSDEQYRRVLEMLKRSSDKR